MPQNVEGSQQMHPSPLTETSKAVQKLQDSQLNALVPDLLQLLRLYCCSFRRSLRHATKKVFAKIHRPKGACTTDGLSKASASDMVAVHAAVAELVSDISSAVSAMEQVLPWSNAALPCIIPCSLFAS